MLVRGLRGLHHLGLNLTGLATGLYAALFAIAAQLGPGHTGALVSGGRRHAGGHGVAGQPAPRPGHCRIGNVAHCLGSTRLCRGHGPRQRGQ